MNVDGDSIIVKKKALDPVLKENITALMASCEKALDEREKLLKENPALIQEVKTIKRANLEKLDDIVFGMSKKIGDRGVPVFVAKKPIDLVEYIRGAVGKGKVGIVPSPQTIESEIMQAFFVSNKAQVVSDRYSGQETGAPFLHPYVPYPLEKSKAKKHEVEHVLLSALAVTDNGHVYLEPEEAKAMKRAKSVFVIATADRLFAEADAEKVVKLMNRSSGGMISAEKIDLSKAHLVIFDNNRLALARSGLKDLLMCINCYSCSLYCPIYLTIGGLFGSPMMSGIGALSAGYQSGVRMAINRGLYTCTLCGRCDEACPTGVPISKLIQKMRKKARVSGV